MDRRRGTADLSLRSLDAATGECKEAGEEGIDGMLGRGAHSGKPCRAWSWATWEAATGLSTGGHTIYW
jgi:hypothetical protein